MSSLKLKPVRHYHCHPWQPPRVVAWHRQMHTSQPQLDTRKTKRVMMCSVHSFLFLQIPQPPICCIRRFGSNAVHQLLTPLWRTTQPLWWNQFILGLIVANIGWFAENCDVTAMKNEESCWIDAFAVGLDPMSFYLMEGLMIREGGCGDGTTKIKWGRFGGL